MTVAPDVRASALTGRLVIWPESDFDCIILVMSSWVYSGDSPNRWRVDLVFSGVNSPLETLLMNILDLVVGTPIQTSDERAEQMGPAQGIPIFGPGVLSSAAYGPEAALSLLMPPRPSRRPLYRSRPCRHHRVAGDRVLLRSPDHRRLSVRRWLLYRGALQPWGICQPACRGRASRGLHPHSRSGDFRRSGRLDLGRCVAVTAHGWDLHRHFSRPHHPQFARRARCRRCTEEECELPLQHSELQGNGHRLAQVVRLDPKVAYPAA